MLRTIYAIVVFSTIQLAGSFALPASFHKPVRFQLSISRHLQFQSSLTISENNAYPTTITTLSASASRPNEPCSQHTRRTALLSSILGIVTPLSLPPKTTLAAPPVAIIAEELGYFPVTNREGKTTYIPARIKRSSTDQAVSLAEYLRKSDATMYGAFWCPHCQRQREMFGREAWDRIPYVECDPRGVNADAPLCVSRGVDGFPTWRFGDGRTVSGEMSLERLARASGFRGRFDGGLEGELPK
eukprot:CAMPEP_0172502044 /NCGR_PEP_ID=MMETSP1066-20121228/155904_1 /TAXON_ID=671091 /ORGANISM="Coscinodiscus wailesii, Strain CCMP2513" /LENGTH=242 /DNA_ID=CAMNT_0013277147 /DNA_START=142 /DNA_END=867 /DNA_ORIENTATION=+